MSVVCNDAHPEMRAGEEFFGNETEEEFRELFASGMRVRMGLVAYDRHGNVISCGLRPVFIADHDPLTVTVSPIHHIQ